MEKIYRYYKTTIDENEKQVDLLNRKIHLLGTVRLFIVVAAVITLWGMWSYGWAVLAGILLLYAIPFAALMVYHSGLSHQKSYSEGLILLCSNELKGLDYDFSAFDGADERTDGEHSFSLDLDLFGQRSFFQSVNRTVTTVGKELLARWFIRPLADKGQILARQEAVRELSACTPLRQHFYVTGKLQSNDHKDVEMLSRLLDLPVFFTRSILWKASVWIAPIAWLFLFAGLAAGMLPAPVFGTFFVCSFLIAYFPVKKINKMYNAVNKLEKLLAAYSRLIGCIEENTFRSTLLSEIRKQMDCREGTASRAVRKLSSHIGILDQRGTASAVLLNIFTFRDIRACLAIERWKVEHNGHVARWFDALAQFDALGSLAGFAFNHPDYTYPSLADQYFRMSGKALGHPLIRRDVCVRNDIAIEKNPYFLIITGANMAGKSTYLRTIGINFLLACIGAPVCAEELTVYPARLVTSLRTSDSLTGNESYFFAELKRLKMIIDRIKEGEELFIILDEILKGTNSIDKQKGSIALMKQLVRHQTCGIIATHDLALGTLENEFPGEIKNYRFEADITNNELTFTYQLREGVAQNMNASFLMQKMGITV